MSVSSPYFEQIQLELAQTPNEYLPALLNIIHNFRESICLNSAEESFAAGWADLKAGRYESIDTLWDNID
ncbi:MAG: hypothetical protein PHQ03_05150 [Methylococcales bacterium]|nr:hypothetical protein [Methylococcales bacterium]